MILPNDPKFPSLDSCHFFPSNVYVKGEGQEGTSAQIAFYDEILSWFLYPTFDVSS